MPPKKHESELTQFINNYRKNIDIDLRRTQKFLETAEKSYQNARRQNLRSEIEINQKNIERLSNKCEYLEETLEKISTGELNNELEQKMNEETAEREDKEYIFQMKRKRLRKNKEEDAKILQNSRANDRKCNRIKKYEQKDLNREYNRFERNSDTLPNYIRKNLSEMPNNKGYIWKNIRFYGELPVQKGQPDILFEKTRGSIMYIHEITEKEHKIFEKKGKERKRFYKCIPRKNANSNEFNLFDFVKK